MIVCLEGPDKCGKSTLFRELRQLEVEHVPTLNVEPQLYPHFSCVERLIEQLWSALYQPNLDYLVDRSFTLTPEVYSRVHGRELLIDPAKWRHHQLVFAILPPVSAWLGRARENHTLDSVDLYKQCLEAYYEVLPSYDHVILDWRLPTSAQAQRVVEELRRRGVILHYAESSSLRRASKPGE